MLRLRYVIIISLVLVISQKSIGGDLLDQALSSVGKSKADLGRAIPKISGFDNYGIGVDADSSTVNEMFIFMKKN
jgi:hypothetical protein